MLRHWVKAAEQGELNPPGGKVATPAKDTAGIMPQRSFFNSFENEQAHGTRYEMRVAAIANASDHIEPFYDCRYRHSLTATPHHSRFRTAGQMDKVLCQ